MARSNTLPPPLKYFLLPAVALALVWSGLNPHDYATWFFELFIGLIGIAVLMAVAPWLTFSTVVYVVVAAHFVILAIGAKYTYAEVPLFNWLSDAAGLARNHFDRVGHFAQGFTPALVTREVLLRKTGIGRGWAVQLVSMCVALAFSAAYEILEWLWVLAFYPDKGPEWLGMQGDPWDAQGDMAMAWLGAVMALAMLSRAQDAGMAMLDGTAHSENSR